MKAILSSVDSVQTKMHIICILYLLSFSGSIIAQPLWKDSVEFIKFDDYGYDKIIFYPDNKYLQFYYSNSRLDIAECSYGKYNYDKEGKTITLKSDSNIEWNIYVDSSEGKDSVLTINIEWTCYDTSGCLLLANDDTIVLKTNDYDCIMVSDTNHHRHFGMVYRKITLPYQKTNKICIVDYATMGKLMDYCTDTHCLNIVISKQFIIPPNIYISHTGKRFLIDGNFNLISEDGELQYYLYDKTGASRIPNRHLIQKRVKASTDNN